MPDLGLNGLEPYFLLLAGVLFLYMVRYKRKSADAVAQLKEMLEAGLTEPSSLHPYIDPSKCMGAGTCASACPEDAIGLINGKAQLINPTVCIGHGACETACPHHAITLVFGTEKRGMDIPKVDKNFQTNIPGVFIAGELGGMGLIRKAATQGTQAIETISKLERGPNPIDVVIVGAGPAGLSAALAAMDKKMRYVVLEQEVSLGGAIFQYPRNKIAMTAPVTLPIIGRVEVGEISKEELLNFWQGVLKKTGMKLNLSERMETITKTDHGYIVKTTKQSYETRAVLLAIGRRGTPRKLGAPGEDLPKVVYRLIDPEQYRNMHALVVGGGDSALEAAIAIAGQPGTTVTLSYRSEAFGRGKQKNRNQLQALEAEGRIKVMLKSNVKLIEPDKVHLDYDGQAVVMPNDAIIVCAGGILPTPFLKEIGILVDTKFGTA
ncbi:MAG: NAD(P)-binding domain-containing protein [Nitrosomonadales bacterium]|nr:NAD(P)-binding domain-containing protein [Nitrosomonadales bacterium]